MIFSFFFCPSVRPSVWASGQPDGRAVGRPEPICFLTGGRPEVICFSIFAAAAAAAAKIEIGNFCGRPSKKNWLRTAGRTKKKRKNQSVSQTIDLIMTIKTSTGSSKSELSSRGKRPFKVFGFSRFFLPQTVLDFTITPLPLPEHLWFCEFTPTLEIFQQLRSSCSALGTVSGKNK